MSRVRYALGVVCLVALAARVWRLEFQSLWWDEGVSIYLAGQGVRALTIDKDFAVDLHPPAYHLVLAAWTGLLGPSVFTSRLLSVFGGVLTVPLTARLTAAFARSRPAQTASPAPLAWTWLSPPLLAAVLAALSPIDVFYSQESRMYPFLPAIGAASLLATVRLLDATSTRRWLAWIAINLIGLYTFYYLGFLTVVESAVLLIDWARLSKPKGGRAWLGQWLAAQLVVVGGFAPWTILAVTHLARGGLALPTETEVHLTSGEFLVENLAAFTIGFSPPPAGTQLLFLWTLLAVIGLAALARRLPTSALLAASALLTPVLLAGAVLLVRPFYYPRFVLFVVVPLWALVAVGLAELVGLVRLPPRPTPSPSPHARGERSTGAFGRLVGFALVVSLLAGNAWSWYHERTSPRIGYAPDDYRAVFATMLERLQPGDLILGGYPWQAGYARAYFWRYAPRAIYVNPRTDATRLAGQLQGVSRAWVLTYSPDQRFLPDPVELAAARARPTTFVDQNGDSRVRLFQARPPAAAAVPTVATFGQQIGLTQVIGPAPVKVVAGASVSEILRWRALATPGENYTVFIHLVGPDGKLWGQVDSPPVRGFFPTGAWTPGLDVVDRYAIKVDARAPVGAYDVEVGLYRPDNGARLAVGPTPDPDNRVIVGSFDVVRP